MKSEFEAVMTGMATQRDAMNKAFSTVTKAFGEQEKILRGFIQRTEERLGRVVDVVEHHEDAISDLQKRVKSLEKRAS